MSGDWECYGSPESVAAMKRGATLWTLVRNDPRFAFYGRLIGLSQPVDNTAEILAALARLQGAGVCYFLPKSDVPALFSALESDGLSTDRHEHYFGGEEAYAAAKGVLTDYSLPSDLTVLRLDEDTPGSFIADTVTLMETCGVMPVPASFLRGKQGRGLCLVASDSEGKPVAVATSIFMHPKASPHAKTVFWGMLATRPDRRGQKIALILGAQAIVHMWEQEGARGFMTGVRQDNASSAALCNRLGVADTAWTYAVCVDPQTLGRKSVTK